jgi:hypothetical protein
LRNECEGGITDIKENYLGYADKTGSESSAYLAFKDSVLAASKGADASSCLKLLQKSCCKLKMRKLNDFHIRNSCSNRRFGHFLPKTPVVTT